MYVYIFCWSSRDLKGISLTKDPLTEVAGSFCLRILKSAYIIVFLILETLRLLMRFSKNSC